MLARRVSSIALLLIVMLGFGASPALAQGTPPAGKADTAKEPYWVQFPASTRPTVPEKLPDCLKPSDEQDISNLERYIAVLTPAIAEQEKRVDALESDNKLTFGAVLGARNRLADLKDNLKWANETLAVWSKIPRCKVEPPPPPPPPPAPSRVPPDRFVHRTSRRPR